ncbi:hypothetical protein BDU57DRAFT_160515 [Ampelomyces quisqualis]|uniref:Uncharacterized protein n=1 Tax=Ampelomyces quisqualis TaxID=50730 RepID=A0A6A5QNE7_AMPQU|nr:hypothetical protein BDU57DRAFT_160515 [Ampelomyces quisqualis]
MLASHQPFLSYITSPYIRPDTNSRTSKKGADDPPALRYNSRYRGIRPLNQVPASMLDGSSCKGTAGSKISEEDEADLTVRKEESINMSQPLSRDSDRVHHRSTSLDFFPCLFHLLSPRGCSTFGRHTANLRKLGYCSCTRTSRLCSFWTGTIVGYRNTISSGTPIPVQRLMNDTSQAKHATSCHRSLTRPRSVAC